MYFSSLMGLRIARLEWIWELRNDSDFSKEFYQSKEQIIFMMGQTVCVIDDTSFQSFSQSILNYYLRTDIEIYSGILIGICIQRSSISHAAEETETKQIMDDLARTSLKSIPNEICENKEDLFEKIRLNCEKDLYSVISIVYDTLLSPIDNKAFNQKDEPVFYVNINKKTLRSGILIGFKLSRLEFIWDSPFEFAQKEFEPSKKELLSYLPADEISLNYNSYEKFANSLMNYYFVTDIGVLYSILIGICYHRYTIASSATDLDVKKN